MIDLVRADARYFDSWRTAEGEFGDAHRDGSGMTGPAMATDPASFEEMVAHSLAQSDPATALPLGYVHCTNLWMVDDDSFVGYLAIRHRLTPFLLESGGHIGYSVRPSRRREGNATRALSLALPVAASLGITRALVTCDEENFASRGTIEANHGALEDVRGGTRRYWIDTAAG